MCHCLSELYWKYLQLQEMADNITEWNIYTAYLECIDELQCYGINYSTERQLDNLVYSQNNKKQ